MPMLPLGVVPSAIALVLYLLFAGVVTAYVVYKHTGRDTESVVNDFYDYVAKGRRRVARLRKHVGVFYGIQLLFLLISFWLGFVVYMIAGLALFYAVALYKDTPRMRRRNGVHMGYEYPHPAHAKEEALVIREGRAKTVPRNIEVGTKGLYEISVLNEPNPHVAVIGGSGSGKTSTVQAFLVGAYEAHSIPFLVIDWSGAYKGLEGYAKVWKVPEDFAVDPLALRSMDAKYRADVASETLQFCTGLTDPQARKVKELLYGAYMNGMEPSLHELCRIASEEWDLERLAGNKANLKHLAKCIKQTSWVFGHEPAEFWDSYEKTCNVIELEGLTDSEKNLVTQSVLRRVAESFRAPFGIGLYIALDDAYPAIRKWEGKETPIARIMHDGSRHGFGLVIAARMFAGFPDRVLGDAAIKFICPHHESEDIARINRILNFTEPEKHILHKMPIGTCFVFDYDTMRGGGGYPAFVQVDNTARHRMGS